MRRTRVGTIHANVIRQKGQHHLSLSQAIDETTIAAPLPGRFSLDRLAREIHLDGDEAAWFSAVYLDELSRREAQDRLNWNLRRADSVRKRVIRKLARYRRDRDRAIFDPDWFIIRGSSLRMWHEERLPCGRSCYALAQVDAGFEVIMNAERAEMFARPEKLRAKPKTQAA